MKGCSSDLCESAVPWIAEYLTGQSADNCDVLDALYNKSPYKSFWGNGNLTGATSYIMNKAAYIHSLAHLALTTHTYYMTATKNDFTFWNTI